MYIILIILIQYYTSNYNIQKYIQGHMDPNKFREPSTLHIYYTIYNTASNIYVAV